MKPIKIISTQKTNILDVRWSPNNVCNYKCRYCFSGSNDGNYSSPENLDLIIKNFNHLAKEYKEKLGKDTIHLKLSGGEPTLWKDLALFIKAIKEENNVYFSIISNGSRTLRWWQENGNLIDNAHLSFHLGQSNLNHIIDVADTLHSYGKKTTVKVLMDPTRWQEGIDAVNYMKEKSNESWFITVEEVEEPEHNFISNFRIIVNEDKNYTREQIEYIANSRKRMPSSEWFEKNKFLLDTGAIRMYESIAHFKDGITVNATPNYYINNTWNSFKGWSCNIGIESIYINWDGTIKGSCGQKLYGLDRYCNILDVDFFEKFKLNPISVVCEYYSCPCQPETHVSKFSLS